MSSKARIWIALVLLAALTLATAVSMHYWRQTMDRVREVERSRLEHVRKLVAVRLERVPICTWGRDYLLTKTDDTTTAFDRAHQTTQGPVLNAMLLGKTACNEGELPGPGLDMPSGPLGQAAMLWARKVDASLEQLTAESVRSAQ
jgi:hypothetical protein